MKFIKVEAGFEAPDICLAEEMICDVFFSYNLKGVVCNVPIEEPDEGFGTRTLPQPQNLSITGFFPAIDSSEPVIKAIKSRIKNLASLDIHAVITTTTVDEKDWADAWKNFFEVTPVTEKIIIKPEWKPYRAKEGEVIIHLDPGMAFGTGTHPTTAMCLGLIEKYIRPGHTFLDVGTGSGILMIAASKLGANGLTGIDTDEVAITVAADNLDKNRIPAEKFRLLCTTLDQTPMICFDLIAANIIAQVIVDIARQIRDRMAPESVAVLSGIINERLGDVAAAIESHDLEIIETLKDGEWVALAVKINNSH